MFSEQKITETLETNYMPYVMSVILSRAIPEIDGFKPAHRKLLYTMYKMGLLNGNRIKSADVVGQTMRLNPHGDGAIYETLVRLTRGNDALLHPFIDSKGNFGKQYSRDMAYAASRYTEVKLDLLCSELFSEIDKETVDFVPNYNGTTTEPLLFPTTFPNLLVTPNQGIAVGMASSICSFNLREVCQTTINYIKNKEINLLDSLLGPDFSTGGYLLYNKKELEDIYRNGRGSFKLRAKYHYDKKNSCIEIYEIPYTTTIEVIIDKIINLVKANKIKDITDIRDETDLHGLKISIDVKKTANIEILMHKLFSMTTLEDSFSCNFNILVEGKTRTMGIKEILDCWIDFRLLCVKRRLTNELENKKSKLHLLLGLSKILLDIDKAIQIIRETEEDKEVIPNLEKGFAIDRLQAEFIAEIKLRNLNKEYLLVRVNERDKLQEEIKELETTISDEKKMLGLISAQLKEIMKKYGKDRRTEIIYEEEKVELSEDDLIEDYAVRLLLTSHGYFKKLPLSSLRATAEQYYKDGDHAVQEIESSNRADLIFFSDKQNAYKAKVYELSDCKPSGLGDYLSNLCNLDEDEKILYMVVTKNYEGSVLFAFANGKIARIPLMSYYTKMNRKKLINAYSNKDKLVGIHFIEEEQDLVAVRDRDKALLFNSSLLAPITLKNSVGVQVYTLKKNSQMSALMTRDEFEVGDFCLMGQDTEFYRSEKLPSSGHFIRG